MKLVAPEERVHQWRKYLVDDVVSYPLKGVATTPPRGCRPLPEEYVEGQQGVHVHLRVEALGEGGSMGSIGRNLCVIFKRSEVEVKGPGQMGCVGEIYPGADSHLGDVRCSMFVHVVKLMELPEGIRRIFIPSVVRLQSLDDCLRVWVDAPDFVTAFPILHRPLAKDGELQQPRSVVGQGVNANVSEGKLIDEAVESTSEAVEAVPDDEAELRRDGFGKSEVDELLTALSVEMTDVSVRLSLSPLTDLRLKAVQVMGGPS